VTRYSLATRGGLPTGRAGLLALSWPVVTIVLSLSGMRDAVDGLSDPSMPLVAGLLFLLAAPTTWLFEALNLSDQVAVAAGVATSLPIWFFIGARLAVTADSWGSWLRRYVAVSIGWAVVAIVLLAVIGTVAG
jgi:hypothetical protein